jgi:hypothetical protein
MTSFWNLRWLRFPAIGLRIGFGLTLLLSGCGSPPSAAPETGAAGGGTAPFTLAPGPVVETSPPGKYIIVSSSADDGFGTIRQALLAAGPGTTIIFDPAIFPSGSPVTIHLASELPWLDKGYVKIDASDAGVILNGSQASGEWTGGLTIDSEGNSIQGLQIIDFSGAGIILHENALHNLIGGNIRTGTGTLGQGNMISGNADGIALFGAKENTIIGNRIGTDVSGTQPMANRTAGIFLQDGAEGNVIGPDNVIAFNGEIGVDMRMADSMANTVTQNSIHDNEWEGIHVEPGGVDEVSLPVILDYDLQIGDVAGVACPSCIVELFSDEAGEGRVFEGSTVASQDGSFMISTGAFMAGPGLTATATSPDGRTTAFSPPISGAAQSCRLQDQNNFPRRILTPALSEETRNNKIGDTYSGIWSEDPEDPYWFVAHSQRLGFSWIRLSFSEFDWSLVEKNGRYSPMEFGAYEDRVINGLTDADIAILYNLTFFDKDLKTNPNFLRFRTEDEIQDYLEYVEKVVTHFKGRIRYYETWNEPDIMNYGQQSIAVQDYIRLIRRVIPVIRAADPQARIVVNGGADLRDPSTQTYLMTILRSDIMPLVDGISLHAMYGSSPAYAELKNYYYSFPVLVQQIKDTAKAHGFKGEFFTEEMAWRMEFFTTEYEVWTYSKPVAAKYYARGIVIARGEDMYAGIGGEYYDSVPDIVRIVQNLSAVLSGAEATSGLDVRIESEAGIGDIRSYAFSLGDGSYLLAFWRDVSAVDADLGAPIRLIFPDLRAQQIIGSDAMCGFQQDLLAQQEGANLAIDGLLAKDFPVFIHLTPP